MVLIMNDDFVGYGRVRSVDDFLLSFMDRLNRDYLIKIDEIYIERDSFLKLVSRVESTRIHPGYRNIKDETTEEFWENPILYFHSNSGLTKVKLSGHNYEDS